MRTKLLLCVMSLLLLSGFNGSASADWEEDDTGDEVVAGYDIQRAKVGVYPDGIGIEEYLTVCIKMTGGSYLPGMIVMEFDVDNDTETGSIKGLATLYNACGSGMKIKNDTPGFDISILLMLRDQGDDCSTAWCSGSFLLPQNCATRGMACTNCIPPGCFEVGNACLPNTPGCFLLGVACTCDQFNCYTLAAPCIPDIPYGVGRVIGEWVAWILTSPPFPIADRGRIEMPLPKETNSDDNDCYKLPWRRIVEEAYDKSGGAFNISQVENPANIKWEISTWYDPVNIPPDIDDFFGTGCLEVTDVIPNDGKLSVFAGAAPCSCDFDYDGNVYPSDLSVFLGEYGRTDCLP